MKPFSSRFFRDSAALWPGVSGEGSTGQPFTSWPSAGGDPLACRAEYVAGSFRNATRASYPDLVESKTDWTLYFPNADPGCKAEDKFILNGSRNLVALGPARRDASGDSVLYAVDCEERS